MLDCIILFLCLPATNSPKSPVNRRTQPNTPLSPAQPTSQPATSCQPLLAQPSPAHLLSTSQGLPDSTVCLPTCLPACLPARLPVCLPACLPASLPPCCQRNRESLAMTETSGNPAMISPKTSRHYTQTPRPASTPWTLNLDSTAWTSQLFTPTINLDSTLQTNLVCMPQTSLVYTLQTNMGFILRINRIYTQTSRVCTPHTTRVACTPLIHIMGQTLGTITQLDITGDRTDFQDTL